MAASYLDKAQVNTAITDNTKLDLGHQHVTTADFMQLNVAMCTELVPGSKIDVNMESFARLNPLPVPTFGRASIRNRAFFVPFRTIYRGWNDFITDSVHIASDGYTGSGSANLLSSVPTVTSAALLSAFTNSVGSAVTDAALLYNDPNWPATEIADIIVGIGTPVKYKFTVLGRQAIKMLESLGYKLDVTGSKGTTFSAMPLLALAKIYCDWYWPQQYTNISSYDNLLAMCNLDVAAGPQQLTSTQVATILAVCAYVQYDSDYFVSAWDQPNQPNSGNYSDFKLVNIDTASEVIGIYNSSTAGLTYTENGYVTNNSGAGSSAAGASRLGGANAPFITPMVAADRSGATYAVNPPISEYLLHSLHALTDYMKRHQLAGSKAAERYLARFGKALPAEKLNRSLYLGSATQDIQIGDVMSTSETLSISGGNKLGAYAGKGLSYGNGHFTCNTDEFGYFIVMSSIVPYTGYFQGIDRMVMRTSKLDFFTPEFDSLGAQPITASELYMPQLSTDMTSGDAYEQVFGFTPRYADYKQSTTMNRLTGNFRLRSVQSLNAGQRFNSADSWHLNRVFQGNLDFNTSYNNVVHDPDFISGKGDMSQYNRIFYYTNADTPDNFTIIHNFEIAEYAPMKPLWDSYEFEDKGKKVTLETNGVKLN